MTEQKLKLNPSAFAPNLHARPPSLPSYNPPPLPNPPPIPEPPIPEPSTDVISDDEIHYTSPEEIDKSPSKFFLALDILVTVASIGLCFYITLMT